MNALMNTSALTPAPPPLNQGQQEIADEFFAFLFSEGKEMIISGPGGTGKTHLMGHLIDVIMPRYLESCRLMGLDPRFSSVQMTATTNQAAEALTQATNRPCSTVHSFLGLTVKPDYTTGEQHLARTRNWKIHEGLILFVDEAYMIDSALLEEIRGSTMNCKIIYVGDHCQLAPVGEALSPIARQGLPTYVLTQPMRTTIPELHALNQQLRNTVETGEFRPIRIVPGIIDYLDDVSMPLELTNTFQNQTEKSRILAYTNRRVVEFNDFVRDVRRLPPEFTTGEFVVSNSAVQLKTTMLSVGRECEILSQANQVDMVPIADGVNLAVRRTTIRTKIGEILTDVPVPVDRDHYDALVKYYKGRKVWQKYYHLTEKYPDLRPRDASTVYKAQGSTKDTVFIDLGNISTCNIANQVARMLYVAVSRARFRVYLYGKLADKYGGLVH